MTYAARDGLTIHAYLTKPAGVPARALPAVLLVHGGPWARDVWGYQPSVQWLANRGYAVLQPNFRGSIGYGKAHLNAGDREWAGAMHTDLLDAKDWLVAQGIADPTRVAIMGGSYGGYATWPRSRSRQTRSHAASTSSARRTSTRCSRRSRRTGRRCGRRSRSAWAIRKSFSTRSLRCSGPARSARRCLIGQGANDPRVKIAESDQIVAAMRANGQPVTYVVFDDEGHGFARPQNNKRFNAAVEAFLHDHLGGRAEPPSAGESIEAYLR